MTFRCRDTNLASKRRKKSKRNNIVARRRCDSAELSDETEDPRHITVASHLVLKQLNRKNWSRSLITSRKEDSSCTHNSTPSSFNIYALRNPNNVGSWDGTTTTCDGDGDELDGNLDSPGRKQGCGIWTKKATKGGCRSCCSPSLSDTLRSSILCGSGPVYHRRHNKHKIGSRSAQGVLPLLTYGTGCSDDDDDELDLEAQSRLDGRRWSTSCRSEVVAVDGSTQSFSQKYRPMFFDELIGQSIVVESLMNALKRCRITPFYLFHGPRGTGKTSTAKIFSAALNCVAIEEMKPCGYCKECNEFISGKSKDFCEVDGDDKVRYLLRNIPRKSSTYKVFVIDECHLLPSKTWLSFLKFLENPLKKVLFVFITTDLDNVPRTIQSRCQKFLFDKVKDADIVVRLKKIASDENLDVESDALELIARNADGSLRDAETMLEQLSLLGKRITTGLVNELVGVVSDEKMLKLLELALSSDTAETVKRARELLDLGADPIVLMSQLASLIMDIIAGTYKVVDEKYSEAFLDGRNLSEADMEGLKHALKLLSEAEKQLRVSNDRSTWFTATLLQLGSMPSPGTTLTGCSSRRQSSRATDDDPSSVSREVMAYKQRIGGLHFSKSSEKLNEIWRKCVEICHSRTLRQLLYTHGKLISISEVEGILVAYIAFGETKIKTRAERFLSSITNSMEMVLRRSLDVRILLLPETEPLVVPYQTGKPDMTNKVGDLHAATDLGVGSSEEGRSKIPMQRIESIIREQRLETAWLQTADKDTPGSLTRIKPERNQILPQEDTYRQPSAVSPSGLNNDVKLLRIGENGELKENLTGSCPLSPSLLHDSKFGHKKDNIGGYESGTRRVGCNMLLCWNTNKTRRSSKGKGTHVRPRRSGKRGFSLFNGCAKPRKPAGKLRR
ncbi:BnaA02g26440D [Brassica napus]|uniref:BnaA02g26440D protein n=1 Tax=Brassica napus TaxID=3708 RepID=A0A078F7K4_BRANA|nr:BnaA02g26440D [Brassica napus]